MSWIPIISPLKARSNLVGSQGTLCSRIFSRQGRIHGSSSCKAGNPPNGGGSLSQVRPISTAESEGMPMFAYEVNKHRPRICILGGGFGGLYTAVRLESLMWPKGVKPSITLIDQNDRFLFKPMMYELLNDSVNEWEIAPEYSTLLAPYSVSHIQSRVSKVEPSTPTRDGGSVGGGTVTLEGGVEVPYDWLVLALGAETNTTIAPGAKDYAVPFATLEDAKRVKRAIECIERRTPGRPATISIVGAGYAGIELAATLAERLGKAAAIQVITPTETIMQGSAPGLIQAARGELDRMGVAMRVNVAVAKVGTSGEPWPECPDLGRVMELKLQDGSSQLERADLVLWTAGQVPVGAVKSVRDGFPFPITSRGFTETDATLRVVGHEAVFAIGDAAAVASNGSEQAPLPANAQVAFQQADYVAWNLWASINKRPLLTFKYQNLGTMMSLGKASGAVSLNVPVPQGLSSSVKATPLAGLLSIAGVELPDSDSGLTVRGPLAGLLRRAAYWYRQPTEDHRLRVGASWLQGGSSELQNLFNRVARFDPAARGTPR